MNRLVPPLAFALALAGVARPDAAFAGAVVIWPVDPTIAGTEQATALWLENKGDQPVTLQVRSLRWSQPQGEDVLEPQDEVVASPPITQVAPGQRQLVRVIRRTVDGGVPERSYRLFIDELPAPPPADGSAAPTARLAVQMRYSIPLFTYAGKAEGTTAKLSVRVVPSAAGQMLAIANAGTMHARLTDLRLVANGRESVVKAGLAGYVLPGATFHVPLPAGGGAGSVLVGVNGRDTTLAPTF
ncbi:fimbrial biogenesis chaperone [Sphingomonas profundi]|uniref:fimbrial biogenesis chaperone n=1 Tax=Alterirhizorhabdus profundi TaxID=2681549 RepID=UPI0012E7E78A|nr:molecular chaperone [Sphingomonas profundi]